MLNYLKLFVILGFLTILSWTPATKIGLFDAHSDIGHPKLAGDAQYNAATKTYRLKGAGYNIWFDRDEFHYLYKKLNGDFTLTGHFQFVGSEGNAHRKIGWMLRESADESASHISAVAHGDGLTVLQWRTKKGANMRDPEDEIFFPKKNFEIIELERKGKNITMRVGNKEGELETVGTQKMPDLPNDVLAGIFICSHDSSSVVEAKAWNIKITK